MPKLKPKTAKTRALKLVKACAKNGFSHTKVAKELGVTQQTISERLSKPAAQEALQDVIDRCLAKAGITAERVYSQLSNQLDASETLYDGEGKPIIGKDGKPIITKPDWNAQDKARKDALELMRHKKNKVEHSVDNDLAEVLKQSDTSKLKDLLSTLKS